MLVELLILILGAGLISELVPKNRLPVLWSLFSAAAVSYFVYRLSLLGNAPDLYLNCPWLKIPNLAVNLEIVVNAGNIYLVFALSILALLVLLQNTFGAENAKNSLNGLVLLNLLSSLMLVFAGNYVQMLVAVGVCDVLVFSAVNNIEAKKKYIYANFLADIGLVSIFAVILGQGGGLELDKLPDYARFGHHKDFVAILLLLCIFVSWGLYRNAHARFQPFELCFVYGNAADRLSAAFKNGISAANFSFFLSAAQNFCPFFRFVGRLGRSGN